MLFILITSENPKPTKQSNKNRQVVFLKKLCFSNPDVCFSVGLSVVCSW